MDLETVKHGQYVLQGMIWTLKNEDELETIRHGHCVTVGKV